MISATNDFKTLTSKVSRTYQMYIVDTSGNSYLINKASLSLPFCSNNLTFGAVSSAHVNFEISNAPLVKNQIFTLYIKHSSLDEAIRLGVFKITQAKKKKDDVESKTLIIDAYDKINFIKKKVYSSETSGQKTVATIWRELCQQCESVGFNDGVYASYTGTFKETTIDSSLLSGYNIRDAMSYLAASIGANVIVNSSGGYALRHFISYTDYTLPNYYTLLNYNRILAPTLEEEDTNIKYIVAKKSNDETISVGDTTGDGVVVTNPIADSTILNSALEDFRSVVGAYRVGEINYMLADPLIKCGDVIPLLNANDEKVANIPVMEIKYTFDGGLSCTIYSNKPDENESLSLAEKINFSVKDTVDSKKYAQAAIDFSKSMSQGMGMHVTTKTDSTGATIYYMHDQEDLETSERIWMVTSEGIGFATSWDGDNTQFITGVNADGNIITNMLTVYQIKAAQIDSDAITSDKIKAGAVTADKIYVEDLYTLNATIADWTIRDNLLYVPSEKQSDGTYNYGVGLSNTSRSFYAGYLSDDEVDGTGKKEYKGSPWDNPSKTFDETKVNFYITREGKLVAKNAEISGRITSVSSDGNGKIVIDNGGFECYSKPNEYSNLLKYGLVKADIDGNISDTTPAMCIQSDSTNSSGIILSANSNARQVIYNNAQTDSSFSYRHKFYGSVKFQNSIWVDSSVTTSQFYAIHGTSRYTAFNFMSNDNLQIGSKGQPGNTWIYAYTDENDSRYDKAVVSMNDFWINRSRGIFFSDGTNYKRAFYCGEVEGNTGFHIGIESQKNYLYGNGIYEGITGSSLLTIEDTALVLGERTANRTREKIDLVASTIRCRGNFLLASGYELQLYIGGTYTCLKYGTVDSHTGIHFGVQTETLDLWYKDTAYFHGNISVAGDVNASGGYLISKYAVVYESALLKTLSIYNSDDTTQTDIVLRRGTVNGETGVHFGLSGVRNYIWCSTSYFKGHVALYKSKYIYFGGTNLSGTSYYHKTLSFVPYSNTTENGSIIIGAKENSSDQIICYGSGLFLNGTSVTSDERVKTEISDLSEKNESFFSLLKPKTFKYINGNSGRTHCGFIAQEVKEAFESSGLTSQDVAAYIETEDEEGNELFSLRYSEFVALNTYMIQKCLAKISSLEDEIKLLKKETINNG